MRKQCRSQKCCSKTTYLQKSASLQPRTSPPKFCSYIFSSSRFCISGSLLHGPLYSTAREECVHGSNLRESKWVFIVNVSSVEYILRSWRVVKFTCFVVNVETKYHLANRPWTEYKIRLAYGISPIQRLKTGRGLDRYASKSWTLLNARLSLTNMSCSCFQRELEQATNFEKPWRG